MGHHLNLSLKKQLVSASGNIFSNTCVAQTKQKLQLKSCKPEPATEVGTFVGIVKKDDVTTVPQSDNPSNVIFNQSATSSKVVEVQSETTVTESSTVVVQTVPSKTEKVTSVTVNTDPVQYVTGIPRIHRDDQCHTGEVGKMMAELIAVYQKPKGGWHVLNRVKEQLNNLKLKLTPRQVLTITEQINRTRKKMEDYSRKSAELWLRSRKTRENLMPRIASIKNVREFYSVKNEIRSLQSQNVLKSYDLYTLQYHLRQKEVQIINRIVATA